MDAPEPGVYSDVHFSEYCEWPLLNSSTLKQGLISMAHLKDAIDGGLGKRTKALRIGRAMHLRFLEPDKFSQLPVATPCVSVLGKTSKRFGEMCGKSAEFLSDGRWYCGTHAKSSADRCEDFISEEESEKIELAYASVKRHPAIKLFRAEGGVEKSFVWEDLGTRLKGRVDKDLDSPTGIRPTILDLKKVARGRGTEYRFAKAVDEYHYDMQAALYVDGLFANDGIFRQFIWVIVEDSAPYAVNVIQMDEDTLRIGRAKYQTVLARYRECMSSGEWPGYSRRVLMGGLSSRDKSKWKSILGMMR